MTARDNFQAWFARPIQKLADDRDSGIVICMIVFPLLERYLTRKTGADPEKLPFVEGLLNVFPELHSTGVAKIFWRNFRHGLLHNTTLSQEGHGLTHDIRVVVMEDQNEKIWLNPVLFAQRVLKIIEEDFEEFAGGLPLPKEIIIGAKPQSDEASVLFYGTSAPPRRG